MILLGDVFGHTRIERIETKAETGWLVYMEQRPRVQGPAHLYSILTPFAWGPQSYSRYRQVRLYQTLVAGVSGTVIETNEDRDIESFQEVVFNPFTEEKYFHVAGSPDEPIATADEVYFKATEGGEWLFLVKNPRGYDEI